MASSSFQSSDFEVFLSFRGEDTRKTFVDNLYSALVNRKISTYKDDETLPRGESIRLSLFKAIEGSRIAVIVFSKNYADSSWCLEELAYIMACKDKKRLFVMPIFYDVVPSEVRKQEGDFGRGFSKQKAGNINKVEPWRKALVDASEIAGWQPKYFANGHESKVIKEIVDTISNKLFSEKNSFVDEDLVGMSTRLQELEEQIDIGSGGVRMVGIWGLGGSGKTTLASSLYMKVSQKFQHHCIIDNIREQSSQSGIKNLQEKFLSRLLKTPMQLQSVEEGKHMIRSRLNNSDVLIILDDIDDHKQLDALAGSHDWFGSGSRIIITTRNEHLLITHKVNVVFPIKLLSDEEAIQLFYKRAYNEKTPLKDYDTLSLRVVSYAARLPLALKVLGSFLYDKDEKEWMSALDRLQYTPQTEILEQLKISFDGLEISEKELFLDIACLYRWVDTNDAMEILDACGYHPHIGTRVLKQKALITIVNGSFHMHDLVREMGHYIVRGNQPDDTRKHSRAWEDEKIKNMCLLDARMETYEIEVFKCDILYPGNLSLFYKHISNMKKLRCLCVTLINDADKKARGPNFLSNELRYIEWDSYPRSPFPDTFKAVKLVVLKLSKSLQKKLWKGYMHLPHLKVLQLDKMEHLLSTPDFGGLPSLQKLTLHDCKRLKRIHPSLGKHANVEDVSVVGCSKLGMFPTIIHMKKLKTLNIQSCHESLQFPEIKSNMESLVKLSLGKIGIDVLLPSLGELCANLISLCMYHCLYSTSMEISLVGLKHLDEFKLHGLDYVFRSWLTGKVFFVRDLERSLRCCCRKLPFMLSRLPYNIRKMDLGSCKLKDGDIPSCIGKMSNLEELNLSGNDFTQLSFNLSQLTRLKILDISSTLLYEFPKLPSNLIVLRADFCRNLSPTTITDSFTDCKWLCDISLIGVRTENDCGKLLESLLQGNAIENHSVLLKLEGLEIAKAFLPPLRQGSRCRLQLPDNWCSDFSGLLMCFVGNTHFDVSSLCIKQLTSGMESGDDAVWKENDNDNTTLVWYVSFASLRCTTWWDETYNTLLFSKFEYSRGSGFGARLVPRKSASGETQKLPAQEDSDFSHYAPKLDIYNDSVNALRFLLRRY